MSRTHRPYLRLARAFRRWWKAWHNRPERYQSRNW